jgi:thiol-disulfide isomerase/thioredoxin
MLIGKNTCATIVTFNKYEEDIKAKTELYGLLILKNLEQKKLVPVDLKKKVLDKIIANLQQYPYIDKPDPLQRQNISRGWHRYMLAYSNFLKYRTEGENPDCLKAAAKYSPDVTDMQRRDAYFYDAYLLEGDNKNVGFQSKYISYLEKNKLFKEELELLLETAYGVPINGNIQKLKDFLGQHIDLGVYGILWTSYVNSKMQPCPALQVSYGSEVLDFTKPRTNWTLIDVWGTWCSPCCKELPHLNEVANKYNSLPNSKIRICTFSYFSTNLKEFMTKNKYMFPVAEVNDEITKPFGVNSYPTKLLVSPDNKYLVIPFNVDWEEYMRNYCNIQ